MVKVEAPPRILVVDDELSAALSNTYVLLDAGYEADMATTSEDALRLLHQHRYAACVVDLVMPELGGIRVCRAVRAMAPDSALVVVDTDPEAVVRPLELDHYLRRPFSAVGLLEAVTKALGRSRDRMASPLPD